MNETIKLILIAVVISIIVLLVSNIELYAVKGKAIYIGPMPKTYVVLSTKQTGLREPIYVFNSKNVKFRDLPKHPGFNSNHYVKCEVSEHLASKLNNKFKEFSKTFAHIPRSSMPVHTLYDTISKGEQVVMMTDPGTSEGSKLRIAHAKTDAVEFFTSDDKFYITKASQ